MLPKTKLGEGVEHTPVVCWIEGGFGSFFSYFKGLPTRNKRIDILHPVAIGVGEPHVLSEETLSDHRKTRQYLMEQCLEARKYLGLEALGLQATEGEEAAEA